MRASEPVHILGDCLAHHHLGRPATQSSQAFARLLARALLGRRLREVASLQGAELPIVGLV